MVVSVVHGERDIAQQTRCFVGFHRMLAHPLLQALAGDVVHAKPRHAFGFPHVDDVEDARMVQSGGGLCFTAESFALIRFGEAGTIHHTHAATADFLPE